ncbi:MAG: FKBP-type peptidyl-prolyl cis-trans isomerase [Lachnospiraceae bacterium]|nr:FKBP-type peptidyl-prolyl cis-trans isomerase [Lachnospiraceae bacterium]
MIRNNKSTAARLASGVLAAVLMMTCAGCGAKEAASAADATPAADAPAASLNTGDEGNTGIADLPYYETVLGIDVDDYITLGDYKNWDIETRYDPTDESVLKAELPYYSYAILSDYLTDDDYITDRTVEDGDITILDYVGKKDGVAFDGGTAEGAILWIGSHTYIDGFEEGLVGATIDEQVDLGLTFPENYQAEELAGQAVVFEVTVRKIIKTESVSREVNKAAAQSKLSNELADKLLNSVTLKTEFPVSLVTGYQQTASNELDYRAQNTYGIDGDTFLQMYGTTRDAYVEEVAKQDLLMDSAVISIAKKEGLMLDDAGFNAKVEKFLAESSFPDLDTLLKYSGLTEEQLRVYFITEDVQAYLMGIYEPKVFGEE